MNTANEFISNTPPISPIISEIFKGVKNKENLEENIGKLLENKTEKEAFKQFAKDNPHLVDRPGSLLHQINCAILEEDSQISETFSKTLQGSSISPKRGEQIAASISEVEDTILFHPEELSDYFLKRDEHEYKDSDSSLLIDYAKLGLIEPKHVQVFIESCNMKGEETIWKSVAEKIKYSSISPVSEEKKESIHNQQDKKLEGSIEVQIEKKENKLDSLPRETFGNITKFLDPQELGTIKRTSKKLKDLATMTNEEKIRWINDTKRPLSDLGLKNEELIKLLIEEGKSLRYLELTPSTKNILNFIENCPYLDHLKMDKCNLKDEGVIALGEKLPFLKRLRVLDLRANNISDEGAKALGKNLPPNLKELYLGRAGIKGAIYNKIGPDGVKALAEKLSPDLQVLDLSDNEIGDGVKALKKFQSLLKLDLGNTEIGIVLVKDLVENLSPNLQILNLINTNIGGQDISGILTMLPSNLRVLSLTHNEISDEDIKDIEMLPPHLEKLNLSGNSISKKGFEDLVKKLPKSLKCWI